MIPVSTVRYSPDAPCVLQATGLSWGRLALVNERNGNRRHAGVAAALAPVADLAGTQRITVEPSLARTILDLAAAAPS